jgi:hypothetical protein
VGLAQRRLGRPQVGIGLQRLGDQVVERLGMEQGPPVAGQVGAGGEPLLGAEAVADGARAE